MATMCCRRLGHRFYGYFDKYICMLYIFINMYTISCMFWLRCPAGLELLFLPRSPWFPHVFLGWLQSFIRCFCSCCPMCLSLAFFLLLNLSLFCCASPLFCLLCSIFFLHSLVQYSQCFLVATSFSTRSFSFFFSHLYCSTKLFSNPPSSPNIWFALFFFLCVFLTHLFYTLMLALMLCHYFCPSRKSYEGEVSFQVRPIETAFKPPIFIGYVMIT
jgi:hypothetical protein